MVWTKWIVALGTIAVVLCGCPTESLAQTLPDAPRGALVVAGRVAALDARWDVSRMIHTFVTLDVTQVLHGTAVPSRLVLKQLGGDTGGVGLWIPEQAVFQAGEDVLVELTANADGALHTAGLGRGKWTLSTSPVQSRHSPVISLAEAEAALARHSLPVLATFQPVPADYYGAIRPAVPAFSFLPTDGDPARWHQVDDDLPVQVDHPSSVPSTWTHANTSLATAAINLWRGSGMELDLRDAGATLATGQCSAAFSGNGRIAVSYNDPCGITDWVIGGGYYTTGDLRVVNGTKFQKFIQGFVVLDDAGPQASITGCFQDAVTHGLGHALGLGHSEVSGAIMSAAPTGCGTAPRGLGSDDRTGITAIYKGIASGPFAPDTPTDFAASTLLSSATVSWVPAATGGAAQRYLLDAGSAPGVYNLGTTTYTAPLSSVTVPNVPAGTYYARLRAQNAIGTSAPTPERQVVVGPCVAPGVPGTLGATSLDTLVNLVWSAPASGIVQGYRIVAGSAPGLSNLATLDRPATPASFVGSAPYGTYFVRVHASNVCGLSAPSNEVTLTVQPCTTAPGPPTALSVTKSGNAVTVSWTAPAGTPPSSYTLSAGSAPGLSNLTEFRTGTAATSFVTSAAPGTYYARIRAENACGLSPASNEITVTIP